MSDPAPVREVAIVGMAPAGRETIGELPEHCEIWSLNLGPIAFLGDRWHRHFEVHDPDWLKLRPNLKRQGYLDWLATDHGKPVYVPRLDDRIAGAVQYPLREVVDRFGRYLPDGRPLIYWQSTVDWMLCLALHEFCREAEQEKRRPEGVLHIVGVDMAMDEEYAHQRPSCEHWLGVALGLGIGISVPQQSDIMKQRVVYGLDTYEPIAKKMAQRKRELQAQLNEASQTEAQARDRKMALRGALDDLTWHEQARY